MSGHESMPWPLLPFEELLLLGYGEVRKAGTTVGRHKQQDVSERPDHWQTHRRGCKCSR
jgi:hypothetical protein